MKRDLLTDITVSLSKMLPNKPWREGQATFSLYLPFASATDRENVDDIPRIRIDLTKAHYDYIKANTIRKCQAGKGDAKPSPRNEGVRNGALDKRIEKAIEVAVKYGGSHHKDWVIDQMVRILAEDKYNAIVKEACAGEDGPDTYGWDCGVAP